MVLLVCALAIRVVVPSGFMLMPADYGLPTLMICGGQGPAPMAAAMDHMAMPGMDHMAMAGHDAPKHDDKQNTTEHPCAFSPIGAAVDIAAMIHPAPPVAAVTAPADLWQVSLRPGLGLAAPPPPKTGPPSLS